MIKDRVSIVISETFFSSCGYEVMHQVLNDTINEFIQPNDRIVNIQLDRMPDGNSRFIVYVEEDKETPRGDKVTRAVPYSVQVNNGNVWLLQAGWNREFIEEHRFFPYSTYKDQVDGASGGFHKVVQKKIVRRIT